MAWDTPDPYYNPEEFGLTIIGTMEWHLASYEYDMTVVWQDAEGKLYWASDSGCSCPSPFEEYKTLDSLETGTRDQLFGEIDSRLAIDRHWDSGTLSPQASPYAYEQAAELKEAVLRATSVRR